MGIAMVLVMAASFLYDPGSSVLMYSALPETLKNWLSFCICWLEELHMLFMFVGIAGPVFQVQVIAFDLLEDSLERIRKDFPG